MTLELHMTVHTGEKRELSRLLSFLSYPQLLRRAFVLSQRSYAQFHRVDADSVFAATSIDICVVMGSILEQAIMSLRVPRSSRRSNTRLLSGPRREISLQSVVSGRTTATVT